ncbi:MAG: CDP-6-deoxy-delta-3,4-glucoseen reductase [Arenicellales bacterium]
MTHRVKNIYNQTEFQAQADETILQAALKNGHLYPYGCQAGACGACKSKLISGEIKHLQRDPTVLSDVDLAAGYCLTCQAVPQGDIEIDVKEVAKVKEIEIKTMPARLREKNLLAEDVVQLFLSTPKAQNFDYLPGQYLNILLKNGKERSFSIANTPKDADENGLELHIRVVPDGHYSPQVKNSLNVKDILRIQGPFGTFFLRKDEQRPIIMVAGGTGFAPIKALIEDARSAGLEQPIHLYWGARDEADLYLHDLAKQWTKDIPQFNYIPVLSNAADKTTWQGETGFVHEAVPAQHADLSAYTLYTAGPPVMINALKQSLSTLGMDNDFFYADTFDYAAQSE